MCDESCLEVSSDHVPKGNEATNAPVCKVKVGTSKNIYQDAAGEPVKINYDSVPQDAVSADKEVERIFFC